MSGWYDGRVWTKPPEVLARDRLLGSYEVRPTLGRLKLTLLAAAGGVMTAATVLSVALTEMATEVGSVYATPSGGATVAASLEPSADVGLLPREAPRLAEEDKFSHIHAVDRVGVVS